jgi:hypothetical protein
MNCSGKENIDRQAYPGPKTVSVNTVLNAKTMANFSDWNIQF